MPSPQSQSPSYPLPSVLLSLPPAVGGLFAYRWRLRREMHDEIRSIMRDYLPLGGGTAAAAAGDADLRQSLLPQQGGKRGGGGSGDDVEGGGGEPCTPMAEGWVSRRRASGRGPFRRSCTASESAACGVLRQPASALCLDDSACWSLPRTRCQVCIPASPHRADHGTVPAHAHTPALTASATLSLGSAARGAGGGSRASGSYRWQLWGIQEAAIKPPGEEGCVRNKDAEQSGAVAERQSGSQGWPCSDDPCAAPPSGCISACLFCLPVAACCTIYQLPAVCVMSCCLPRAAHMAHQVQQHHKPQAHARARRPPSAPASAAGLTPAPRRRRPAAP